MPRVRPGEHGLMGNEDTFVSLGDRRLEFLRAPGVFLHVVAEGFGREIPFGAFSGAAQIVELFPERFRHADG